MILNNLKNAIRKKQLYFTIEFSSKNLNMLYDLLRYNIISSFKKDSKKNKYILVFINYASNFFSPIVFSSKTWKKTSLQKNKNIEIQRLNSNYLINITNRKVKNLKSYVKFR